MLQSNFLLDGSQKRMCLFQLAFPSGSAAITHAHSLTRLLAHLFDDKLLMNKNPYENDAAATHRHSYWHSAQSLAHTRICLQTDGWFVSFVMFLCMFSFIHSWKCRHTCKHPLYFDCSAAAVAATTSHFSVTVWMIENRGKKTNNNNEIVSIHGGGP